MAPLPDARTASHVWPLTYVDLDYFGPMLDKQGRNEKKRWIALFTCLTICAVHLEVVHNLTTESCKMAVKRRMEEAELQLGRRAWTGGGLNEVPKSWRPRC